MKDAKQKLTRNTKLILGTIAVVLVLSVAMSYTVFAHGMDVEAEDSKRVESTMGGGMMGGGMMGTGMMGGGMMGSRMMGTGMMGTGMMGDEIKNQQKRFSELKKAVEQMDYEKWQELLSKDPNADKLEIPRKDFENIVKMIKFLKAGERGQAIRLGQMLNMPDDMMMAMMKNHMSMCMSHMKMMQKNQELKQAIKQNDFDKWAKLMKNNPFFRNKISKENFEKLRKAFELRQKGEFQKARKLMMEVHGIK